MLLRFPDPSKLRTKKVIYENAFHARDPGTLEQLKELSSWRKLIEESINEKSLLTEAIAREMAGGLTSRIQQDLRKLELYLPVLEDLVVSVEQLQNNQTMLRWISDLKIQWSSSLGGCSTLFGGPRFFRIDNMRFELGMSTYLYGALLRDRAFEILSEDLMGSSSLYRRAAGVYQYLSFEVLVPFQSLSTNERPLEVLPSMASIMSLICLADAQGIAIKRSEEKGISFSNLSKLHYGITEMLNEASSILKSSAGNFTDVSLRLVEYLHSCSFLHQLRSQRYFAEDLRSKCQPGNADGKLGVAVSVLRNAMANLRNVRPPRDDFWREVFDQEVTYIQQMLKKFEHENNFVYREKVPDFDQIPVLEGRRFFEPIPYCPKRFERQFEFQI